MKIIIWGYPLHSHTHSYIHEAFYKAFKYLGHEVYWFHDKDYPINFDYSNSVFLTEGYADNNIPLNKTSIYYVHVCINPEKYVSNTKRLIDIRYNEDKSHGLCSNYNYDLTDVQKIGKYSYYKKIKNGEGLQNKFKVNCNNLEYEAIYIAWGTNLLPYEITEDVVNNNNSQINFSGTIGTTGPFEIFSNIEPFKRACDRKNIKFVHNDPWSNPLSHEDHISFIKKSLVAPDIRCKAHVIGGYIPCRLFKNTSIGHLGITNSKKVYDFCEGEMLYEPDTFKLLDVCLINKNNIELIKKQKQYIKENHTYVNRINDLLSIL